MLTLSQLCQGISAAKQPRRSGDSFQSEKLYVLAEPFQEMQHLDSW